MRNISNLMEENWKIIQNPSENYYKILNVQSEFCLETDQDNCNDQEKNLLKINKCDQNNLNQRFAIALFNSMVIAEPKVEPLNFKVYCIRAKHSSLSLTTISNIAGEKVIQAKDVKGCPKWNFKPVVWYSCRVGKDESIRWSIRPWNRSCLSRWIHRSPMASVPRLRCGLSLRRQVAEVY